MKIGQLVSVVILSAAVAVGAVYALGGARSGGAAPVKETRLEQVKRAGVIRCGYVVWSPCFTQDPNTGKRGGVCYELMEEVGRQLKLKIDWAGEVATAQILSDLSTNKYDALCTAFVETPNRAREGDFTVPIFYMPYNLYVRKNDVRFDHDFGRVNQPEVKLAILEGAGSHILASESFPKATQVSIPEFSGVVDQYMMVVTGKADATIQDPYTYAAFATANPDTLRPAGGKPVSVIGAGFLLPANEPAFKAALNTTIAYLHDSGFIDRFLDKYETSAKFVRVAKPYANDKGASP